MSDKIIKQMYDEIGEDKNILKNKNVAHLMINYNKVIGMNGVPGLDIDVKELDDGIDAKITLKKGTKVEKPVHICFGMLYKDGVQRIVLDINIEENAEVAVLAHCVFPTKNKIKHIMDARINIGKNARYSYLEKHVHGEYGLIEVYPKAKVYLDEDAHFTTEFNLIKGRVGLIDIEYEAFCKKRSILEMNAKISGSGDDIIKISEIGHLEEYARGALTTNIAVKDKAKSSVFNKLRATGAYARGHVDCKEIVLGEAVASATPIVEVLNPKAHITHEAAIGSVDKKQLETLMSRGMSEDEASDLIIKGLLS